MTDAEATIKHAIHEGIVGTWHKQEESNYPILLRDNIFDNLFDPTMRWAVEEYLYELNKPKEVSSDTTKGY